MSNIFSRLFFTTLVFFIFGIKQFYACAVCYGASGDPTTKAANMAIGFLLLVVASVLGGIASFFIRMIKRIKLIKEKASWTG